MNSQTDTLAPADERAPIPERLYFSARHEIAKAAGVEVTGDCNAIIQATLDYLRADIAALASKPAQTDVSLINEGNKPASQALAIATEALDEIALAGMSGTGQESDEAMTAWHARRAWEFIGIAARAKAAIAALAANKGASNAA